MARLHTLQQHQACTMAKAKVEKSCYSPILRTSYYQEASQCQKLTRRKVTACLPGFVRAWALVPVVLQLASRRKAVWRRGWKRIIQTNLLWHIKYESVEQPVQAWRGQQEVGEGALLLGALWRGGWQELPTLLGCTLPTERRLRIDLRQIWQQCLAMLD